MFKFNYKALFVYMSVFAQVNEAPHQNTSSLFVYVSVHVYLCTLRIFDLSKCTSVSALLTELSFCDTMSFHFRA